MSVDENNAVTGFAVVVSERFTGEMDEDRRERVNSKLQRFGVTFGSYRAACLRAGRSGPHHLLMAASAPRQQGGDGLAMSVVSCRPRTAAGGGRPQGRP
jgi:hypothetical protein